MLKYVYIGGADICFWWTVWLLFDHYYPIKNYGAYSYLRGYLLIISANLLYLGIRIMGRKTFDQFWETHNRSVYPSAIVTSRKAHVKKSLTFHLLKMTFPLCVYILVVGFIQVWRGLFATFGSLVDLLQKKYNVNPILSCVIAEVFVALTLAFTQKNNAVNLCPTHKMYKYDELYFMDRLFFINLFGSFRQTKNKNKDDIIIIAHYCEGETIENKNAMEVPSTPTLISPSFSDGEFDVVEFATARLINVLHRNRLKDQIKGSAECLDSLRKKGEDFDAVRAWRAVIQSVLENKEKNEKKTCKDQKKIASSTSSRKISIQTKGLSGKDGGLSWFKGQKVSTSLTTAIGGSQRKISKISSSSSSSFAQGRGGIIINVQALQEEEEQEKEEQEKEEKNNFYPLKKVEKKNRKMSVEVFEHSSKKKMFEDKLVNKTKENGYKEKRELVTAKEKYLIKFLGYLYAIHHRQVFLHIFGGMFWSTTWKLYDFATESFFTKTTSDIPGLALIAIMCHCLNHLVLFRFKEMATRIHWKTFWEFFCGLFTVSLWASTWYVWDILLNNIGKKIYFFLFRHFSPQLLFN